MSAREKKNEKTGLMQLITGILLTAEFGGFIIWNVLSKQAWVRKPSYVVVLTVITVLYILVAVWIVGRSARAPEQMVEAQEEWFDRTVNLNDLLPSQEAEIEYEITFIHSDFVVM